MLLYEEIRRKRGKFLGLTGLTNKEFQALLPYFEAAYQAKYEGKKTQAGKKRQRAVGGGQKGVLPTLEQKLLFILVYQKTYPVQIVMAELFGMSQSSANEWIKRLLPILGKALEAMGVLPERKGKQFAKTEARRAEKLNYIIDGTERRRQRPKDAVKQALHYSGKKKVHSDKNLVIVQASSTRIGYLSPTHPGKTHDKKVADSERIRYPRNAKLYKDTGFQGYEPKQIRTYQPKKTHPVEPWQKSRKKAIVLWHKFVSVSNMPFVVLNALAVLKIPFVTLRILILTALWKMRQACIICVLNTVNVRFGVELSYVSSFPITSIDKTWAIASTSFHF